jgi:hypothetical protein
VGSGKKAARGQPLTEAQKQANKLVSRERAANEHGFADLKNSSLAHLDLA